MKVDVVRSRRRRKTIQAEQVGDGLRLSIPASLSKAEEAHWVDVMVKRFERRAAASSRDLDERAAALARKFELPVPASIRWVGNQHRRWGSCTPSDGTIRISDRLAACPPFVLDYVILHELAHLVVPGHGKAFHAIMNRYPLTERARGFLLAMDTMAIASPPIPSPR
jgi:predicted metal-dependent hydrolase